MQTKFITGGTGSWLNLPYFNHEEGTRYAYKDDFEAATIGEFFEMYDQYVQESLDEYLTVEQKTEEKYRDRLAVYTSERRATVDFCVALVQE